MSVLVGDNTNKGGGGFITVFIISVFNSRWEVKVKSKGL
jgi:hypothetical protein